MTSNICKRCQNRKFYKIRRGKNRCKNCGYEFKERLGKLGLSRNKWKKMTYNYRKLGVKLQTNRLINKVTDISG